MSKYSSDYFKEYYRKNKTKRLANDKFRKYGITQEDFDKMLKDQKGLCKICGTNDPKGKGTWCIDHDHATGIVRALLCTNCNSMLGHSKDNPEVLRKAATFLDLMYVAY